LPAASYELFESTDNGIGREPPARDRKIGRGRAVTRTESAHTVGPEALRRAACGRHKVVELGPRRGSVPHELV
jgi:hypothetical protein